MGGFFFGGEGEEDGEGEEEERKGTRGGIKKEKGERWCWG